MVTALEFWLYFTFDTFEKGSLVLQPTCLYVTYISEESEVGVCLQISPLCFA